MKMKAIIDESEDSVIVFTNKMGYNMNKQILGKERMSTDNFLQRVVDVVLFCRFEFGKTSESAL